MDRRKFLIWSWNFAGGLGLATTLTKDGLDAARKTVKTVRRLIGNVKYQPALGPSLMSLERRDLVHRCFGSPMSQRRFFLLQVGANILQTSSSRVANGRMAMRQRSASQ